MAPWAFDRLSDAGVASERGKQQLWLLLSMAEVMVNARIVFTGYGPR